MSNAAAYEHAPMHEPTWLTRVYAIVALIADAAMSPAPTRPAPRRDGAKAKRRAMRRERRFIRRLQRPTGVYF